MDFGSLIGKALDSADVSTFRATLGTPNVDDEIDDDRTFYEHIDGGVLIAVEKQSKVVSMIQLHREGVDGYRAFKGALPVAFDADIASVKAALGEPASAKPAIAVYHRGGFSLAVNFDKNGRAKSVCFYA